MMHVIMTLVAVMQEVTASVYVQRLLLMHMRATAMVSRSNGEVNNSAVSTLTDVTFS